jgi:hypothetical protein
MNIIRISVLPALLLLAGDIAAQSNVVTTRLFLTRPEFGAPDLDAKGYVRIRSHDGGDREVLEVRAFKITLQSAHELWMDDGLGTMTFVANLSGGTTKKFVADTQKGDPLPFDLTLAELAGRRIEVQVNGELLLASAVPTFVVEDKHKFAEEHLDVPPTAPNQGAQGMIKVKANDQRGLQYLRIKAKDLGWQSFTYNLWIEDEKGQMVESVEFVQYGKRKGRIILNTRAGMSLPLGALYLDDISGRKVEIRDQNGLVVLEEFIPPLQ